MLTSSVVAAIAAVIVIALLVYVAVRIGVRFLVRRVAGLVFVLLAVTFITFILGHLAPGNAVYSQLGLHASDAQLRHQLEVYYGFNLPWYTQYLNFLNGLIHFNLGISYLDRSKTVWDILSSEVPISAELGVTALVLALLIGVPLGIVASLRTGSKLDTFVQTGALVLFALPSFVIIPFYDIAMVALSDHNLPFLPTSATNWSTDYQVWIAPIIIFALISFAYYVRLTRTSMLEVLRQDYVRTARAKGLHERTVILRHAFRNALIPLVTAIGPALAYVVNGAFIIEVLFNIPGIGAETISSVVDRDFPVLEGTVIILAFAVAMMNLATDIVYGMIDPRIQVA